jgi:hypothetical protein
MLCGAWDVQKEVLHGAEPLYVMESTVRLTDAVRAQTPTGGMRGHLTTSSLG